MLYRPFVISSHRILLAVVFALAFVLSFSISRAYAAQIRLQTGMAQKFMTMETGSKGRKAWLHISLEGLDLPDSRQRAPVNVALVIDRSGSMSGHKLKQAKRAAIMALGLLQPFDTVSIVTYSSGVEVLVPATRLDDRAMIERRIEEIFAGGSTALYAGVKEGGEQLEDYAERQQVSRLILLSDGLANVGPKTPEELADLGYRLVQRGISVTTLGLGVGYNEDLMTRLANVTDGNHAFVENANELEKFFALELGDITSVVAQDIDIEIRIRPGYIPRRTLWRRSTIKDNVVRARIRQVYGAQKKDLTLELLIPPGQSPGPHEVADVIVSYRDAGTTRKTVLRDRVGLTLTNDKRQARASVDKEIMARVVALQAIEKNRRALKLRDKGMIGKARKIYRANAAFLKKKAAQLGSASLARQARQAEDYSQNLEKGKWRKYRKLQKHQQRSTGAISKY